MYGDLGELSVWRPRLAKCMSVKQVDGQMCVCMCSD